MPTGLLGARCPADASASRRGLVIAGLSYRDPLRSPASWLVIWPYIGGIDGGGFYFHGIDFMESMPAVRVLFTAQEISYTYLWP